MVFWVLRIHTDQRINHRLDANQYDPDETIELKVPVALPYPIYSQDFQRVDGRFEHEGEFFKLVKHKLHNDTLYIVCIRDHQTRELVKTMDDYLELTQGVPARDHKPWNFLTKLIKDFYPDKGLSILPPVSFHLPLWGTERTGKLTAPVIPVLAPPPKG